MANNTNDFDEVNGSAVYNPGDVLQTISNLCMSTDHADVVFLVENHKIPAHRAIVSARCAYFDSLLNGGFAESSQSEIELKKVPLAAFKQILRYIYTGLMLFIDLDVSRILDVCTLADLYGLERLKSGVLKYLIANISLTTCCEIFDWATKCSIDDIQNVCFEFMERNARLLLSEESFKNLSISSLSALLERKTFYAREIEIFNAVKIWLAHNKDADVKEAIKQIRWSLISTDDLSSVVFPSDILDQAELVKIIAEQKEANVKGERFNQYEGSQQLPSPIEIDTDNGELADLAEETSFLTEAKRLKHLADRDRNLFTQCILYLESSVQFSLTGLAWERNSSKQRAALTLYKDTLSLVRYVSAKCFKLQGLAVGEDRHKRLLHILWYQSLINFKLFKLRYHEMRQHQEVIESFQNNTVQSSSTADSPLIVSIPINVLCAVNCHTSISRYVMGYLNLWERADIEIVTGKYQDWFKQLDEGIGKFSFVSPFKESVEYVQAAIQKIKSM